MDRPLPTHRRLLATGAVVLAAVASIATSEQEPQARSAPARQTLQVEPSTVAAVEWVASVDPGAFAGPVEVLWLLDLRVDAAGASGPLEVTVRSGVDPVDGPPAQQTVTPGDEPLLEGFWRRTRCEPSVPCELRFTVSVEGAVAQVPVSATVVVSAPGRGRLRAPLLEAR
jgi:hypothetical protein